MKLQFPLAALSLTAALFSFSANVSAQCTVTGPTPDGGEVVSCTGTDSDGYTGTGNDDAISVDGGNVSSSVTHVIHGNPGDDSITLNSGTVTTTGGSTGDGLKGGDGNDTITVTGGSIDVDGDGIDGDSGNDTITVSGGTIHSQNDDGIDAGSGDDVISISNASVTSSDPTGQNVNGGSGNDTITLGTGAVVNATIDCSSDTDTLEFAMAVASADLATAQADVAGATPAGDTISIGGQSYTWLDCEVLQDSLVEAVPRPATSQVIPTMSVYALALTLFGLLIIGAYRLRGIEKP